MSRIYLDNAATTPPLPMLEEIYRQYAESLWQNPSALYGEAGTVRGRVEEARRQLLAAFGSPGHRCVFTSGGTEGANMVVQAGVSRRRGGNYVCGGFEHPSVEEAFRARQAAGEEVRIAPVDSAGRTEDEALLDLVDDGTLLVSVMHVNNETGARNDVESLAAAVKRRNPRALVHVDGVQAFLRVPLRDASSIDYYTVSAHKVHALKGTGALFYRQRSPLKPLLHGGGQEQNLRSGTENTLGIMCFGAAAADYQAQAEGIAARLTRLNRMLREGISGLEGSVLLSPPPEAGCDHILSVSFPGLRGETLLHMLEGDGITVSTGAACSSRKGKTRMERALGVPRDVALGAIRVSLGRQNNESDVEQFLAALGRSVETLRRTMGRNG